MILSESLDSFGLPLIESSAGEGSIFLLLIFKGCEFADILHCSHFATDDLDNLEKIIQICDRYFENGVESRELGFHKPGVLGKQEQPVLFLSSGDPYEDLLKHLSAEIKYKYSEFKPHISVTSNVDGFDGKTAAMVITKNGKEVKTYSFVDTDSDKSVFEDFNNINEFGIPLDGDIFCKKYQSNDSRSNITNIGSGSSFAGNISEENLWEHSLDTIRNLSMTQQLKKNFYPTEQHLLMSQRLRNTEQFLPIRRLRESNMGIHLTESLPTIKSCSRMNPRELLPHLILNGVDADPEILKNLEKSYLEIVNLYKSDVSKFDISKIASYSMETKYFISGAFRLKIPGNPLRLFVIGKFNKTNGSFFIKNVDSIRVRYNGTYQDFLNDIREEFEDLYSGFGIPLVEMRTKSIKIDGVETECVLLAGGPGFKIYSCDQGIVLVMGRKQILLKEKDPDFITVMKYVNLRYYSPDDRKKIEQDFSQLRGSLK